MLTLSPLTNATCSLNQRFALSFLFSSPAQSSRFKMSSSDSLPPLPDNRILLGCGSVSVDFLATVASYPQPDDKIRSTSLKVQGGGNAGNALTCAARLGLNPRLISKVADDSQGKGILEELEADGVDTSFFVVSNGGTSPFTYVIVDSNVEVFFFFFLFSFFHRLVTANGGMVQIFLQIKFKLNKIEKKERTQTSILGYIFRKTRTCIHTPGSPPMMPDDLSQSNLLSAIDGARIVYFDGRLHETALVVAREAARRNIPILIDAERKREGLDDLLGLADFAVCSAKFPQAWTEAPSISSSLVSMLLRLQRLKFVIVTLGDDGCIMLQRTVNGSSESEEMEIDSLLELLKQRRDGSMAVPACISSSAMTLKANGIGTVSGRLFVGTAEKIPLSELVDTTGAGDAFIGAVLYAICAEMPPEKMLPFAAQVAAANCRALGARGGLPVRSDPRLASFL
ncbi:uncharacterized protein LOC110811524 [Carica papaya]|uniref:uncharacterized protein LOC110811524 n=1 Tax=Carica papaya TaxID=3649 RepID=UPI000B8D0B1D|nr:uncharacterized protein LOC110811524 [Carica papaya]